MPTSKHCSSDGRRKKKLTTESQRTQSRREEKKCFQKGFSPVFRSVFSVTLWLISSLETQNVNDLYLVTGGAGFIGSHLVEALTASGRRVRVLDNLSTGCPGNLASGLELIEGDISDPKMMASAMAGVSHVFHLAALASVQKSVEAPLESHQACATGTLTVLDAARRAGVKRVVYAASASAYGIPEGEIQSESTPIRPLSPYAAAKLAGELYCESFAATYGLETVRLRFFNIFGPRQRADSPYSGVIAIFVAALTEGRIPTVFGDGLQTRDFTSVHDVVQALTKAAEVPNVSGEVFNIGTGRGVSLLELLDSINVLLKTDVKPKLAPARAGDIRHSRADIARAQARLGYRPTVSFEEGLAETIAWYRSEATR
jgi:UDP-glucose 4-epimerase